MFLCHLHRRCVLASANSKVCFEGTQNLLSPSKALPLFGENYSEVVIFKTQMI